MSSAVVFVHTRLAPALRCIALAGGAAGIQARREKSQMPSAYVLYNVHIQPHTCAMPAKRSDAFREVNINSHFDRMQSRTTF